ncbi:MAG: hypothetical protein ACOZDY_20405 [Pseudomonadota bacterium]
MLTLEDCLALSDLTEDEIEAIAEHEHIPELVALELGNYLVQTPAGEKRIRRMIVEDIEHARTHGDLQRVALLKLTLKHYLEHHADARLR